ncbi:MAG TPA: DUF2007 domain-containing protein [Dongiaceae bacterium]|nr:DUF2007 domain-containing protein [Dongiaceae bacterium]
MASFYDTVNDADLKRVEGLLRKGGIVYTLRDVGSKTVFRQVQVAEEDLAAAEKILYGGSYLTN